MIEVLVIAILAPIALISGFLCLSIISSIILELKDIFK